MTDMVLPEEWWRVEVESRSALIAAQEEHIAILERYIREGDKALTCTEHEAFDPPCGGCDGCITAQVIHSVKSRG
jgi:predicted PP-loop superfamily ATPase